LLTGDQQLADPLRKGIEIVAHGGPQGDRVADQTLHGSRLKFIGVEVTHNMAEPEKFAEGVRRGAPQCQSDPSGVPPLRARTIWTRQRSMPVYRL
jgi:hypothetical protein